MYATVSILMYDDQRVHMLRIVHPDQFIHPSEGQSLSLLFQPCFNILLLGSTASKLLPTRPVQSRMSVLILPLNRPPPTCSALF